MQLHHGRGDGPRGLELFGVGADEQRHPDASLAQRLDVGRDVIGVRGHVEAPFGGQLLALFRHQAGGVGPVPERDLQHFRRCRHLEIEGQVDLAAQSPDIVVRDVPAILAQVRRNPVGPGLGGDARGPHGIGMAPAARVADGRNVVDVDAEAQLAGHGPASWADRATAALTRQRLARCR